MLLLTVFARIVYVDVNAFIEFLMLFLSGGDELNVFDFVM